MGKNTASVGNCTEGTKSRNSTREQSLFVRLVCFWLIGFHQAVSQRKIKAIIARIPCMMKVVELSRII